MEIINTTPHDVNIVLKNGEIKTFPKTDTVVRCGQSTVTVGELDGIPLTTTSFGDVVGLPAATEGVYYIVSRLVLSACPNRNDLIVPNDLVRNEQGNIIGCRSFSNK